MRVTRCNKAIRTLLVVAFCAAWGSQVSAAPPEALRYNFDVQPVLSDRCYRCHGPDEGQRQAELRLDVEQAAKGESQTGEVDRIIQAGDPKGSELYRRIVSDDPAYRMPPPDSNLSLSEVEIENLRRWIEQGAKWESHWSLTPPGDVAVPAVDSTTWCRNEIDRFVLARLQTEGLSPSPVADKTALIRRLSFDLTGLPPATSEIDAFLADDSPGAYERLVDRLLESPRFGERMAVDWLDVARYADTYGYQADVYRDMSPWRDWVIRSFNGNLPYDQFITWQLAGDLLPGATRDPILATAFNRNHRQTNEGGSIEEEFRTEYVADRVNTFGAAFLGLTLECCRCHDHKYDPLAQQEYYELSAFFNSIDESGLYSHFTDAVPTPTLLLTTPEQDRTIEATESEIEAAEAKLAQVAKSRREACATWQSQQNEQSPTIAGLVADFAMDAIEDGKIANRADADKPAGTSGGPRIVPGKVGSAVELDGENNVTTAIGGDFTRDDAFSIALWIKTPDVKDRAVVLHRSRAWTDAGSRGYELLIEDGRLSFALVHFWPGNAIRKHAVAPLPIDQWVHVAVTYDGSSRADGLSLFIDGEAADCETVRDHLYKNITGGGADELTVGQRFRDRGFQGGAVDELKIFRRQLTPLEVAQLHDSHSLARVLAKPADQRAVVESEAIFAWYLHNHDEPYRTALAELREVRRRRSELIDPIAEIMVMRELPEQRPTYLLKRGAYDAPGKRVSPDVPDCLPPLPEEMPRNRLALARWLTLPHHPLTARVAVNRFWQGLFGRGLVATPEDFGRQGQLPSHPELLDRLSRSFVDSGWDVKGLLKQMVMSATYRQSSDCSPELRARDPENVLLARGASYRLPAEMLRDSALLTSGLLVEKIGGPPVKPYQPEGLWEEKSGASYVRDKGEGSHRRSLYTFWKRTSPPPAMMTFDAANREVCVVRRQTTTTPLQALVLLNDPQYVEAARALAENLCQRKHEDIDDRLIEAFRRLTSKSPSSRELDVLRAVYEEQLESFGARPGDAEKLLAIGDSLRDASLDASQVAAMTVVVEMLMSHHRAATKW